MDPHYTPSSVDVKQNICKYLERAKSEIISKINDRELQMKSDTKHSLRRGQSIDKNYHTIHRKISRTFGRDSGGTLCRSTDETHHNSDFLTQSGKERCFRDENSAVNASASSLLKLLNSRGRQNTRVESSDKGGNSISNSFEFETSQGVSPAKNSYKEERTNKRSPVTDYNDDNPKAIYWDIVRKMLPLLTDKQKTALYTTKFPDGHRLTQLPKKIDLSAGENHPGMWHKGEEGFVPPETEPIATTRAGFPLFAGRVNYKDNLIPATVSPEKGLAYFTWDGQIFCSSDFDILEIHSFAWMDEGSALDIAPLGRTAEGRPLYLGRVYIEGMGPWVGRVDRDEKRIVIAFRGNELRISQPYEVFVMY